MNIIIITSKALPRHQLLIVLATNYILREVLFQETVTFFGNKFL